MYLMRADAFTARDYRRKTRHVRRGNASILPHLSMRTSLAPYRPSGFFGGWLRLSINWIRA